MRENYRNSIASINKFPQFTTMNVIDGQAGLIICASLIFYSLTIDNILNIIVLLILATVTVAGIINESVIDKSQTIANESKKKIAEQEVREEYYMLLLDDENFMEYELETQLGILVGSLNADYPDAGTIGEGVNEINKTLIVKHRGYEVEVDTTSGEFHYDPSSGPGGNTGGGSSDGTTETVKVTFNPNGGSNVYAQTLYKGGKATKPRNPTKSESIFSGWYSDAELTNKYNFAAKVNQDITLYAKWIVVSSGDMFNYLELGGDVLTITGVVNGVDPQELENIVILEEYEGNNGDWIGYGIKRIADDAFKGQTEIKYLMIPDSVEIIGKRAFQNCTGIAELSVDAGLIGEYAFSGCTGLTGTLDLQGKTTIEKYAFNGCNRVQNIIIGDSVTALGEGTFQNCTVATKLTMPISLNACTNTGTPAFKGCSNINLYTFTVGTSYGYNYSDSEYKCTPWWYANAANKTYSVNLNNGIKQIGNNMFRENSRITYINLPDTIEVIGNRVFYSCTSLAGNFQLNKLTSIGDYAFNNAPMMTITIDFKNVTNVGAYAFKDMAERLTGNWNLAKAKTIGASAFEGCTAISGEQTLASTETIGDRAFYNFGTRMSGELNLKNIKSIGSYAFYGCSGLTGKLEFPEGFTTINPYVFYGCSELKKLIIPNSVEELNNKNTGNASCQFTNCTELEELTIPITLKNADWGTYGDSTRPFQNVTGLKKVTFTKGKDGVGLNYSYTRTPWYFSKENLTQIVIAEDVVSIGNSMFKDCSKIDTLTIPKSVTTINENAFNGCSKLVFINYYGNETQWQNITIANGNTELNRTDVNGLGLKVNSSGMIDTGINLASNYKIETKISIDNLDSFIWKADGFGSWINSAVKALVFQSSNTSLSSQNNTISTNQVYEIVEESTDGNMSAMINGDLWINGTENNSYQTDETIKLFVNTGNSYASILTMYYFKVYDSNNQLVLDMIPVPEGQTYNGKVVQQNGFYDRVSQEFFYSDDKEYDLTGVTINCIE